MASKHAKSATQTSGLGNTGAAAMADTTAAASELYLLPSIPPMANNGEYGDHDQGWEPDRASNFDGSSNRVFAPMAFVPTCGDAVDDVFRHDDRGIDQQTDRDGQAARHS